MFRKKFQATIHISLHSLPIQINNNSNNNNNKANNKNLKILKITYLEILQHLKNKIEIEQK